MVKYHTISPPESVRHFVRSFWVLESDAPTYTHVSMANVCPEMIFHYKGRFNQIFPDSIKIKSFTSGIHAQSKKVTAFNIEESFAIFGVYLFPYAIPTLFGIPANELTSQLVDLDQLLGREGCILEEQVMLAENTQQRIEIVSEFLRKKTVHISVSDKPILNSVNQLIQCGGLIKVKNVADYCCISERQLERKFKELTGLPPKVFTRISRFNAAIKEFGKTTASLTELAYKCGYYDQSHFIQDFKEFSGYNPKAFFSGKVNGVDWLKA